MGKANLSNENRYHVVQILLANHKDGRLCMEAIRDCMRTYDVCEQTVRTIWKNYLMRKDEAPHEAHKSQMKGSTGRKHKYDWKALNQKMQELPLHERSSLQALSNALKVPVATVRRLVKAGKLPNPNPPKLRVRKKRSVANYDKPSISIPWNHPTIVLANDCGDGVVGKTGQNLEIMVENMASQPQHNHKSIPVPDINLLELAPASIPASEPHPQQRGCVAGAVSGSSSTLSSSMTMTLAEHRAALVRERLVTEALHTNNHHLRTEIKQRDELEERMEHEIINLTKALNYAVQQSVTLERQLTQARAETEKAKREVSRKGFQRQKEERH